VETLRERDLLISLGCDVVQGFLYSQPVPAHELRDPLAQGHITPSFRTRDGDDA